jgi:hypothetical protein
MDRFALSFRATSLSATSAAALAAMLAIASLPAAATDADRVQAYQAFRGAFDARRYAEAAPLAEKLIALTEQELGAEDKALVNPLANLGAVQFRLANMPAAESAFQRAVAIAEARATGSADAMLIRPLHGLGEVYLATKRFDAAAVTLDRAAGLIRNLRGLYDESQLAVLPSLIESYSSLQNFAAAEKEHQYAFRVAETAYGRSDRRLLGPLDRYARWYEFMGRYTTARVLHAHAMQIAEKDGGQTSLQAVNPLRGLARTYWLEYIYGPEEVEQAPTERPDSPNNLLQTGNRLNPDGEKALLIAIATLNKQTPVNHAELGDTLVDLADWYLIVANANKAGGSYKAAWQELEKAGQTEQLAQPRQLFYRPSAASVQRFRPDKPEDYEQRSIETRLTVGADGRVSDAVSVASDAPEANVKMVLQYLKRARYRPRVDATGPVETKDVSYTELILVRKPGTAPAKS